MNHIYSVIWNAALGRFHVVSELGRRRNRAVKRDSRCASRGMSSLRPTALAALCALMGSGPGWAVTSPLPQGAKVMHGHAVTQVPHGKKELVITQTSPKAILEWDQFNIDLGHKVTFKQPNINSIALNRVLGNTRSRILGSLTANGRVFLVNPNGVVFGREAMVDVGSLVASTLNITNENFLDGVYRFEGKGNSVHNHGKIKAADGGAIILLGGQVINTGTVLAHRGTVALTAGSKVILGVGQDNRLEVAVDESVLNAQVSNHGQLIADGGDVWMIANATDGLLQTVINNTGHIRARSLDNRGGIIRLWAAGSGASTQISGSLDVSAEKGDAGGISIWGPHIQIQRGTKIHLNAQQGRRASLDVEVTSGDLHAADADAASYESRIDAAVLSAALEEGDVRLKSGEGNIQVDAPVSWQRHLLRLDAQQDIHVNSVMTASGTATLEMNHGGHDADTDSPATWDDSGVHMALSDDGFTGRVDFKDVLDQSETLNPRLKINGESYALLTEVVNHPFLTQANATQSLRGITDLKFLTQANATQSLRGITDLNGNYAMAADVGVADGSVFTPIGTEDKPFTGRLDGLGHKITNLSITPELKDPSHVALLGVSEGDLRNLDLDGGESRLGWRVGSKVNIASFVGELRDGGRIANVRTSADVSAVAITGKSASVTAGNIVGKMAGGAISNAHAYGSVTATANGVGSDAEAMAGGIAGNVQRGSIINCSTRAKVTSSAQAIALKGNAVQAKSFVGGATGSNAEGVLADVISASDVRDQSGDKTVVSIHDVIGNDPEATIGEASTLRAAQLDRGFYDTFIGPGILPPGRLPAAMPAVLANAMPEAAPVPALRRLVGAREARIPAEPIRFPVVSPIVLPLEMQPRPARLPATPISTTVDAAPSPEVSPEIDATFFRMPTVPIPSTAMPVLKLPARASSHPVTPVTPVSVAVEAVPSHEVTAVIAPTERSRPVAHIPSPAIAALELPTPASRPATPVSAAVGAASSPEASPMIEPMEIGSPALQIASPAFSPVLVPLDLPARASSRPATPVSVAVEAAPLREVSPMIAPIERSSPAAHIPSPTIAALELPTPPSRPATPVSAAIEAASSPEASPMIEPMEIGSPALQLASPALSPVVVPLKLPARTSSRPATPARAPAIAALEPQPPLPSHPATPVSAAVEAASSPQASPRIEPMEIGSPALQLASPALSPVFVPLELPARASSRPATPVPAPAIAALELPTPPSRPATPVSAAVEAASSPQAGPMIEPMEIGSPALQIASPALSPVLVPLELPDSPMVAPIKVNSPAAPIPSPAMVALGLPVPAASLPATPISAAAEAAPSREISPLIAAIEPSLPAAQIPSPVIAALELPAHTQSRPATPVIAALEAAAMPADSPMVAPIKVNSPAAPLLSPAMVALELPAPAASLLATPVIAAVQAAAAPADSPNIAPTEVNSPAAPIPLPAMAVLELPAPAASLPATSVIAPIEAAAVPAQSPVIAPIETSSPAARIAGPGSATAAPTAPALVPRMPRMPRMPATLARSTGEPKPAADAASIPGPGQTRLPPPAVAAAPGSVTAPPAMPAAAEAPAQASGMAASASAKAQTQAAAGRPAPDASGDRADPLPKLQSLPGYAAAKATMGGMTRRAPPPAAEPAARELPYTVIDGGVRLPLR